MTENEIGEGEGEGLRAYRAGKRRFFLVLFVQLAALAAVVAALFLMSDGTGPGALPAAGAVVAATAVILIINVGGWWSFRVVDELEVRYNLIAFTVAFYAHMTFFSVWALLWGGGLAEEPDAFAIFIASAVASFVAYLFLKLRSQ